MPDLPIDPAEVTGVEYAPSHTHPDGAPHGRFPAYAAIFAPEPSPKAATPPKQQRPRLDRSLGPVIVERARHEILRGLAAEYGVSHETIRAAVQRAGRPHPTPAAAD